MLSIQVSAATLTLADKLGKKLPLTDAERSIISLTDWFNWNKSNKDQKDRLSMARLNAALLQDLAIQLKIRNETVEEEESTIRKRLRMLGVGVILLAGLSLAALDGFLAMFSILMLVAIPFPIVIAAACAFAICAIAFFCITRLPDITGELQLSVDKANKLLDAYIEQMQAIKALHSFLLEICLKPIEEIDVAEIDENAALLEVLKERLQEIKNIKQALENRNSKSWGLSILKYTASGMGASLLFCGGFFLGLMAAAFFVSGPIGLGIAVGFGLASVLVYCYAERAMITPFINKLLGIDDQKIKQLEKISELERKLDKLSAKLTTRKSELTKREEDCNKIQTLESKLEEMQDKPVTEENEAVRDPVSVANKHGFFSDGFAATKGAHINYGCPNTYVP